MSPLEVTSKLVAQASLADFTHPSLVIPNLRATDTPGAIAELSHALQRNGCISDVLPLYHSALNRELMATTAHECGIAFPHARSSGVKRLQFAIGRAPWPIRWGPNGTPKVHIVFLLAVPATDSSASLHLLAAIARLAKQHDIVERMQETHTASDILSLLSMISVKQ